MECKKCKSASTILLRKKDRYCNNCFLININHKFRACIGKSKILSSNDKVLICLSGGLASVVLLDLIYHGIHMDIHKKLRIVPTFLHLIDTPNDINRAEIVKEQCKKYGFDVYIMHTSKFADTSKLEVNQIPLENTPAEDEFQSMLKSLPHTTSIDLLQKIKRNLFVQYATFLQCSFIFTADTTSTLAINLLSNLALGRGSQIKNDIGFCDTRDDNVKILRPMKDISKEELDNYRAIKCLVHVPDYEFEKHSLQSVVKTFVTDLQESFQATISTVCKTADKIDSQNETDTKEKCVICKNNLDAKHFRLTALEATNLSKLISYGPQSGFNSDLLQVNQGPHGEEFNEAVFPLIYKNLCYGCSRSYSEIEKCKLSIIQQKFQIN